MAYKVFDPAENNSLFEGNDKNSSGQDHILSSNGQDSLELPDEGYIRDADLSRDGMDLVLETDQGTVTIENYFADAKPPNLVAPNGVTLTPELVNSFTQNEAQYADAGGSITDASPIGVVQEISGNVTVTRENGTVDTAGIGTPVYQGDIIETDEEGAVNIMFVDETTFAVSEDARLAIDEYVFDPATQSGTSNFSVLKGVFVFTSGLIGRDDPDDVEIDTPSGSIGIRGTIIAGDVDSGEITVIEGAIVLRDFSGNSLTLSNQYETARFMPESNTIEHMGKMVANDVVTKFTSVSNVNGTLFSSIHDSATESQDNLQNPAEAQKQQTPAQEATEDSVTDDSQGDQSDAGEKILNNPLARPKLAEAIKEMITSEDITQAGTIVEFDKLFESLQTNEPINEESAADADGSQENLPPPLPPSSDDPAAVFSVTVQRLEVQENNSGLVEVAVVRGHFTTGMTMQLNGQSQNYFDIVQIDPKTYSIVTKPGIVLGDNTFNILNFTATDIDGFVISRIVGLNVVDDVETAQFDGNSPNNVGGANVFSASDDNVWVHDFSNEFNDPDGQITSYSYELYDSTPTLITSFPTPHIDDVNLTNSGIMALDFGDVIDDTYTLIVHAYDANGDLIDSTDTYTFETWDLNSSSTTLVNNETVSFGAGMDTITIVGDDNLAYTEGGDDTVIIAGNNNDVHSGIGQDDIIYNSGTDNNVFTGFGDDTFTIQAGGTAALASGASNLYFDGGSGNDKLAFATGGTIDFTAINDAYLHNIEVISSVQGAPQVNDIILSRSDVFAMTDENNTVIIEMDASDTFDFVNDGGTTFIHQGTTNGGLFDVYTDTTITLLVSTQGAMAAGSDLP